MKFDGAKAELYKAHQTGLEKYTYFLLAAAGAAIGFAVQKTEGLRLTWWLLPVALATLTWALSFVCGCKNISYTNVTLNSNMELIDLQNGHHPVPGIPHDVLVQLTREKTHKHADRAHSYGVWQFRFLILGAAFFIAWRVVEMARLTLCVQPGN
ncbi:putative membrane protein [Duganella sp. 3397]|uniref:hypothetical protein n=1 Tax=Duganella sp. 3397 TaxID=2817732 RepID=UPI00285A3D64|nr:hypothetical protein [Duganella sp. 3397]MDR7048035.1 putative membrane protein [Duganella sp. 3397]